MTLDGTQVRIEPVSDKEQNQRRVPVSKIRLNGRWYKFWHSRPIEGNIKQVTVKRDALGDFYITIVTDVEWHPTLELVKQQGSTLVSRRSSPVPMAQSMNRHNSIHNPKPTSPVPIVRCREKRRAVRTENGRAVPSPVYIAKWNASAETIIGNSRSILSAGSMSATSRI